MPSSRQWLTGALLVTAMLAGGALRDAQGAGYPRRAASAYRSRMNRVIQNVQKDIAATQKQLKEAQESLNRSSREVLQAEQNYKSAKADVERAKKTLTDRLGPKVGLPAAQSELDAAKAEYDKATARALTELKKTPEFEQSSQRLKAAEEKLASLRGGGTDGDRKERLAEAAKEALKARESHRALQDSHPLVKPARERLTNAEKRMEEVHARLHREMAHDSELQSAESEFRRAKGTLEKARAAMVSDEQRVEALQQRLITDHSVIGR